MKWSKLGVAVVATAAAFLVASNVDARGRENQSSMWGGPMMMGRGMQGGPMMGMQGMMGQSARMNQMMALCQQMMQSWLQRPNGSLPAPEATPEGQKTTPQ